MQVSKGFAFASDASKSFRLTIQGEPVDQVPVQPELFGNFLENLGASFHGGVLAQMLANPMMAEHNLPPDQLVLLKQYGDTAEQLHRLDDEGREAFKDWRPRKHSTGFGSFILDDDSAHGIPLPWKVRPAGMGTGQQPGRINPSVKLQTQGREVVLSQGVIPPIHRGAHYHGVIWARASGSGALTVQWRNRGIHGGEQLGPVLNQSKLPWPGPAWQKLHFTLELPDAERPSFWPADFCISLTGAGTVWIDRVLLFPHDHVDGFDPDALAIMRRLAPPVLRWPGGNFASDYHFWHGIGPEDRRMTLPNEAWGGIDTNLLGIDEFILLCRLLGAEPHICVNQGSGTAAEASAWVEYCNGAPDSYWGAKRVANGHPKPYNVRYWEVGNEVYGPWQIGHCGPEENAQRFREWSTEMKAVDPSITVIGTGSYRDFVEAQPRWNPALLKQGGSHLDCVSLHSLPENHHGFPPSYTETDVFQTLMAQPRRWETVDLPHLVELILKERGPQHPDLAITEWGILGESDKPEVGNHGGAIYAALLLHVLIRCKQWIRVAQPNGLFHAGCIRRFGPATYWDPQVEVLYRYSRLDGGLVCPITATGPSYDVTQPSDTFGPIHEVPFIDGLAVLRRNRDLEVSLVNRSPERTWHVDLELAGFKTTYSSVVAQVLEASSPLSMNTPLQPRCVQRQEFTGAYLHDQHLEVALRPASIVWLTLK